MKTIKELKSIGFHCKNFTQAYLPSFFYDEENKKILKQNANISDVNSEKLRPCVVKSLRLADNLGENMESEYFRKLYNAKLVAWYPAEDYIGEDKNVLIMRFCILEE